MGNQIRAILWAQWRSMWNHFPRSNKGGLAFTSALTVGWYGIFAYFASLAALLLSRPEEIDDLQRMLPAALLLCFLYWQLIPVLMASLGSSLEMRKLMIYPVPKDHLFTVEVLLRISSGVEMFILMIGAGIGLLLNPKIHWWTPAWLGCFVIFNLCCSAGIRDLLVRLLARKRVREIVVFLLVIAAALPQLLLFRGSRANMRRLFSGDPAWWWPWTATAHLALGRFSVTAVLVLLFWTAVAYLFGRWQFERGLRFDFSEAAAWGAASGRPTGRLDRLYRFPALFLPDPLGALVEKELRFLSRAPRFRLVFLMGFSFGLIVWAPMAFGSADTQHSLFASNYLTLVSVYALLLLSDALFWNCFGFDRSAVQVYFSAPVNIATVLHGKNLAAGFFVLVEILAIAFVCTLLRLPTSALQVGEALLVACVLTLFLLSIGNLSSIYNPRSVNPAKSFRTAASGRTQALLMLGFPVSLIPVALAYLARYAFNSEAAFVAVLLVAGMLGGMTYHFSMDSAVKAVEERKEQMITALSRGEGPIES